MSSKERFFKKGQSLFREGDPSLSMFLIKEGTVTIRKGKSGSSVDLARCYSGEVIGELAFFDRRPRSAAAIADGDVKTLEIDYDGLQKIYDEKVPDYLKTIIASTAERLRKANDMIRKLQRYAPDDFFEEEKEKSASATEGAVLEKALNEGVANDFPAMNAISPKTPDSSE